MRKAYGEKKKRKKEKRNKLGLSCAKIMNWSMYHRKVEEKKPR